MNANTQVVLIDKEVAAMQSKFQAILPRHVDVAKFSRVLATAVNMNPDLAKADRRTLWAASMKCAADGLLPDGREAALVTYRRKDDSGESLPPTVTYIPMVAGIMKRARQSGEIANWSVHCVFKNDEFTYELGDFERMVHKPNLGERGEMVGAYSIVTLSSGERSREFMSKAEIDAIRKRSKAANNGPWVSDYTEMAKKTVIRRHSKRLPMSTDVIDWMQEDDSEREHEAPEIDVTPSPPEVEKPKRPRALQAVVDSEPEIETDVPPPAEEQPV